MPTALEIYHTLEARRIERGLSQAEVGALAFGKPDNSAFQALRRGSVPSADKLEQLCMALGLEFYFGPPRDPKSATPINDKDFAAVPRFEAEVAAGGGQSNGDQDVVLEALAFRRDWLKRLGVSPPNACLVKVRGDSMEPLLRDHDMVLIDRGRKTVRSGHVYALVEGGDARVKRLERPDDDTLVLRSDNPSYPLEFRRGGDLEAISILGQVVWSGHTL